MGTTKGVDSSLGVGSEHRSGDRDHRGNGAALRRIGPEAEAVGGVERIETARRSAGGKQDVPDEEGLRLVPVAERLRPDGPETAARVDVEGLDAVAKPLPLVVVEDGLRGVDHLLLDRPGGLADERGHTIAEGNEHERTL